MSNTPAVPHRVRQIGFGVGLALYVVSFFLPAMGTGTDTPATGWSCAWVALTMPLFLHSPMEIGLMLFACGLINPLLLSYLLLRMLGLSPILRRVIAILTLAFIPLSWMFIVLGTPMIGHFAWIAGLLLMLVPEAVIGARGPSPVPSTAAEASPAPQK